MIKPFVAFLIVASVVGLSSCADKMTDRHSELVGGMQGPPPDSVRDNLRNGTPSNTNGNGQPVAGGNVNAVADTMWNQSSPLEAKAF